MPKYEEYFQKTTLNENDILLIADSQDTNKTKKILLNLFDNRYVNLTTAQTITNKSLVNTNCFFVDDSDITKRIGFQTSGAATGTTTTLISAQTGNISINLPIISDTLVGRTTTDTLTNKTLAGAIVPTSSFLQINGAMRNGVNSIRTTATTLSTTTPQITLCDASTAAFNVTLPATTAPGITFTIKKIDSSANAVTVLGNIDGATNYVLSTQYKYVTLITTATSGVFFIISNN